MQPHMVSPRTAIDRRSSPANTCPSERDDGKETSLDLKAYPKVTVEKGKASVYVKMWGGPPFAIETKDGHDVIYPNKFQAYSTSDNHLWLGETKVEECEVIDNLITHQSSFKFTYVNKPDHFSEWRPKPTTAYREALASAEMHDISEKFKGANGRLVIGVSYRNLQEVIHQRFATEIFEQLQRKPVLQPLKGKEASKMAQKINARLAGGVRPDDSSDRDSDSSADSVAVTHQAWQDQRGSESEKRQQLIATPAAVASVPPAHPVPVIALIAVSPPAAQVHHFQDDDDLLRFEEAFWLGHRSDDEYKRRNYSLSSN